LVKNESSLETTIADGVLGVGIDIENDPQNSFILSLYKQGVISTPVFSFYLTDSVDTSRLFIGDVPNIPKINNSIKFCNVKKNSHYWQCTMNQMSFSTGEKVNLTSQLVFDTGTSYIIVPLNDFNIIKKHVIDATKSDCRFTPNLQLICKCYSPSMYPKLNLVLDGQSEFEINFENIIDYYPFLEYQCRFQLVLDIQFFTNVWIIGDSLLRNMFISFDMSSRRIGFVQDINLYNKNIIEEAVLLEDESAPNNDVYFYLSILAGVLILFVIIYKCTHRETHIEERPEYTLMNNNINNNTNANNASATNHTDEENKNEYDGLKVPLVHQGFEKSDSFYDKRLKV